MTTHNMSLPHANEDYFPDPKRPENEDYAETERPGILLSSKVKGRLLLILVALLYGTYDVAARVIYEVPVPPTSAAFSATRGWISFFGFLLPLALHSIQSKKTNFSNVQHHKQNAVLPLLISGLELAIWNCAFIALSSTALLSTEAARASSLSQLTVVFTPLISLVFHGKASVSKVTCAGCCIALLGLLFMAMGGSENSLTPTLSKGDLYMLGGAFSMSMYIVRTSALAPKYPSLHLQGTKTGFLVLYYSAWWLINTSMNSGGLSPSSFFPLPSWMTSGAVVWIALTYAAIGTGTIADILQQKGQELISSTETSIIMSTEPAFAAVFGVLLLGETPSKYEFIGGGLMVVAVVVVSFDKGDSADASEMSHYLPSDSDTDDGSDPQTNGGFDLKTDIESDPETDAEWDSKVDYGAIVFHKQGRARSVCNTPWTSNRRVSRSAKGNRAKSFAARRRSDVPPYAGLVKML